MREDTASSYCRGAANATHVSHYLIHHMRQTVAKERASQGGQAKAAKLQAAKEFVLKHWHDHGHEYDSKAHFSRVMAGVLLTGDFSVTVTARQIETKWLPKLVKNNAVGSGGKTPAQATIKDT